jgi:hypothetical protein
MGASSLITEIRMIVEPFGTKYSTAIVADVERALWSNPAMPGTDLADRLCDHLRRLAGPTADVRALQARIRIACVRVQTAVRQRQRDAVLRVLVRYVPKVMAKTVLDDAWNETSSVDAIVAHVMQALRVFCEADKLAAMMVDLAEICASPET